MKEQVIVSIKGLQIGKDSQRESITSEHEGRFFEREGKRYVMYNENTVDVEMRFKMGEKKLTNYDTQFGGFTLGFKTKNISCIETDHLISLDIDYVLDMNYEYMADCHINIRIKEKES